MIQLTVKKGKLELLDHSQDASLAELLRSVEDYLAEHPKQTVYCRMCGECCHHPPVLGLDIKALAEQAGCGVAEWASAHLLPPVVPDLPSRAKSIEELRTQTGLSRQDATILYEFNQSEAVTFLHDERDRCFYQRENLCSNYAARPYICRLYLCRFGDRLQALEEMIVTQGTWHAYSLLGRVPAESIAHNPFLRAETYGDVLLRDFLFHPEKALGELFVYF